MVSQRCGMRQLATAVMLTVVGHVAVAEAQTGTLAGVPCVSPPPLHCDAECTSRAARQPGQRDRAEDRTLVLPRLPVRPEAGRAGGLHSEPARRRIDRQLAAALLPGDGLQGEVPLVIATPTAATHRSIAAGAPAVRMWTADADDAYLHELVDYVFDAGRTAEHQGVLARRPLAGRHDVEPHRVHRFLQGQGRWLAQPVGRTHRPGADRSRLLRSERTARDPERRRRTRPARSRVPCRRAISPTSSRRASTRSPAARDVAVGAEVRVRRAGAPRRCRRHDEGLRHRGGARTRRELGPRRPPRHGGSVRVSEVQGRQGGRRRAAHGQGPHRRARAEVTESLIA